MTLRKAKSRKAHWSSVARWTVLGTSGVTAIAVGFNSLVFADLGTAVMQRAMLSSGFLSVALSAPLFMLMSLKVRDMAISNVRLNLIARTDALTACLNRAAFTAKTENSLARGKPGGALLMIDADHFKAINDRYGHDLGDEALTIIARSIRAAMRPGDLVGRMGGEEFGVYLPGADVETARQMAERIRRAVKLASFTPDGTVRTLSVSIGGEAFWGPMDFAELFRLADRRLYSAKASGRDQIAIGSTSQMPANGPELTSIAA